MHGPPALSGIHHFKLAVANIENSKAFYTKVLGLAHIPAYDHISKSGDLFAVILSGQHRGIPILIELRENAEQALKQVYWNPVTWAVPGREDLERWKEWFEGNDVKCSKVFTAMKGWVLCALDPDDRMVRLYSDEGHEWTAEYDEDEFWLR